jgi:hypothetical protein
MSKEFGHTIRVLLTGEYIDGFVQPNGGWKTIWVADDQDEWTAIRKAVGDVRRVIRYEQVPSPQEVDHVPSTNKRIPGAISG